MSNDPKDFTIEETSQAGVYRQRRKTLTEKWMGEGQVEPSQHEAAMTFWQDFQVASLGGRFSSWTIERVDTSPGHRDRISLKVSAAKQRVADAMRVMGDVAGDAVWDVIGNEMSLREYVVRRHGRPLNVHEVKGRVIVGLDLLAGFYGYKKN